MMSPESPWRHQHRGVRGGHSPPPASHVPPSPPEALGGAYFIIDVAPEFTSVCKLPHINHVLLLEPHDIALLSIVKFLFISENEESQKHTPVPRLNLHPHRYPDPTTTTIKFHWQVHLLFPCVGTHIAYCSLENRGDGPCGPPLYLYSRTIDITFAASVLPLASLCVKT